MALLKQKINGVWETVPLVNKLTIDSALSDTSTNPVQNKVIKEKLDSLDYVIADIEGDITNALPPDSDLIIKASTTVSSSTSTIDLPFTLAESSTLLVYLNGILLTPDIHYTNTSSVVTLNGWEATAGDILTFFAGPVSPNIVVSVTATDVNLIDSSSNYPNCTTVEDALKYIAENGSSPIKSISVNGTAATPNSAGNVNINVPIRSMSINSVTISPDTNGKVALTNLMENNKDQSMQAKLIAQSNTDYAMKQVRNIFLVPKSNSDNLPTGSSGDICIIYKDN